jgi:macrolide transport system ATP-binding/permease protein
MRVWSSARARLSSIFRRNRREADLDEELRHHIDRETERLAAGGLDPVEARLRARQAFGSIEMIKEESRDARGITFVEHLRRDTRHGVRRLARDWKFTLAAVVILGLGIGVNTAVFSIINAVLFRSQAIVNPDTLVDIYQNAQGGAPRGSSYPAYLDMAAYTEVFANTAVTFIPHPVTYADGGSPRQAIAENVSASYLTVLGLRPALGRWFTEREDALNAPPVAVIGHRAWTTRFASDAGVVGRIIRIEGMPVTVVGVGPANHAASMNFGAHTDFWMPLKTLPMFAGSPRMFERNVAQGAFMVKARLQSGVTVAQAQAAMTALGSRLAREYPKVDKGAGISVYASRDVRIHPQMDVILTGFATALLAIVGLVLAIACSNLATLLLVRGAARVKEVSVRLAVGATRAQLVRHLLTESVLLALAGGVAGCLLAWWTMRWLSTLDLPVVVDFSLDLRVLAFALALSFVTGILFGLAPALRSTRVELWQTLRDDGDVRPSGRRVWSLKNALVVFQVAVSVFLLAGTGLALQMMAAGRAQPVGYAVDGVAMIQTDARYVVNEAADQRRLLQELLNRVAAIPGVQAATLTRGLAMDLAGGGRVEVDGANDPSLQATDAPAIWAGPGFFETMQIPILYGRALDERDREGSLLAAVVNESMARRYFGAVNAIGRRFRTEPGEGRWMTVVGVARDTWTNDLGDIVDPVPYMFYMAMEQWRATPTTVVARTTLGEGSLVRAMEIELRRVDERLPVLTAKTMAQVLEDSVQVAKGMAAFFTGLGTLGLTLAGIGLYAVIAFAVARKSREIGIRMALGAGSQQVVWSVARGVAALVAVGTAVGLALWTVAVLVMKVAPVQTSGVANIQIYQPDVDPLAMLAIAAFTATVGALASFVPARRATRMDPLIALRHD